MKINAKAAMSGEFTKIEILGADGKVKRTHSGGKNLITDVGLARLAVGVTTRYCRVGTGSSTPKFSDQSLDQQIASTATVGGGMQIDIDGGFAYTVLTYTFALGAVVGNVSELATGWHATTTGTIFSRALIRDALGNPTTITVLADEILRVSWEFKVYWPTTDTTGTLVNSGNKGGTYDWVCRAANIARWRSGRHDSLYFPFVINYGGSRTTKMQFYYSPSILGAITGAPTGTAVRDGINTRSALPSGTKGVLKLGTGEGNGANGISCLLFAAGSASSSLSDNSGAFFQIQFTPPIQKTSLDLLEIELAVSWARA